MSWPTVALILVTTLQVEIFLLAWAVLVKRPERKVQRELEMHQLAQKSSVPTREELKAVVDPKEGDTLVKPPEPGWPT